MNNRAGKSAWSQAQLTLKPMQCAKMQRGRLDCAMCNVHLEKFWSIQICPKRPEIKSGCYKSQSFFFPKTSKNPTQPGNSKLNNTSLNPDEFGTTLWLTDE